MLRTTKPRNARSKRVLESRAPREHEQAKKAIFVRGPHTSDKVALAFRDLSSLKRPDVIQFSKKNDCLPFEEAGSASLEFWSGKNDASLFVVGNSQKKRKDNLAFARVFDGKVLDIIEVGILEAKSIAEFKSPHMPTLGARPLFHFSGPHFSPDLAAADSDASHVGALSMCNQGVHATFQHLKSFFLDFYRGEEAPPGSGPGAVPGASGNQVALRDGLQHVVCITEAPEADDEATTAVGEGTSKDLADLYAAGAAKTREGPANLDPTASGRKVYMRVYAVLQTGKAASGGAQVELKEVGPSLDFVLRRRQPADAQRLAAALKRPKTAAEKNTQGKSKRKNVETDDMGDMVGRVHMQKQDLTKLQTRKMKGLKVGRGEGDEDEDDDDEEMEEGDFDEEDGSELDMQSGDDDEDDDMADLMGSDAEGDDDDDEGEDDDDEEEEEAPAPAAVKKQRKA